MPLERPVPLADRLVEVIADRGETVAPRYRYGSGCIVRGRTVLTAAHVVEEAATVQVRDPDKKLYPATVVLVGDVDGPGPDLALVEIDDPALDLPAMGLARVERDSPAASPVERCHAIGYPEFAETTSSSVVVRETVDAIGVIPVLSKMTIGLLSVQVTIAPRPLPPQRVRLRESAWAGMSGGPVVADGRLLGVVTEHAPREGPSAIMAVPLSALEPDPAHPGWGPGVAEPVAWWARLGVTGLGALRRLPASPRQAEPAYEATLREFGRILHQRMPQLVGRRRELEEIAAFAISGVGYRWLVGGAFAGKTALLYAAVTAGLPTQVDAVCYFLSRRAADADSNRFLAAVVPQLAHLCGLDPPPADRDQFHALWQQATDRAAELDRHLLLVVDGLDEDLQPAGSPSVALLLPTPVEGPAHVLVTSRHHKLPEDVPDEHALRTTGPVELPPFAGAATLAGLARQEIHDLTHGTNTDLAVTILGLLTAAAGPLSVRDLATLSNDLAAPTAERIRQVRRLLTEQADRSLEPVRPAETVRYQFAHYSLLEYAQATDDLCDPEYRDCIHQWAQQWRDANWPTTPDITTSPPQYLLDSYPSTLAEDPQRLAALTSDVGWVDAAIQSVGVDRVLADLRQAAAGAPTDPRVGEMLATVVGQAYYLRPSQPLRRPGYVAQQLCIQAAEQAKDRLANDLRARLRSQPGPSLVLLWTTRRTSRALAGKLGLHSNWVYAVAGLMGGRVVSSGLDGRVLVWDLVHPGSEPLELGRHGRAVFGVAVLADGQVVSGGWDGRVLVWDPAQPGSEPLELGHHNGSAEAVAGLPDGQVVSSGLDGRVLVWNPAHPGNDPLELGRHDSWVQAVAGLADGRVVSGDDDGWVLVWDPAQPDNDPLELGRHDGSVRAVAELPDGRVASGGGDRRVLVWDPAHPVPLNRHDIWADAVAVLADGRVVAGHADGRVLMWDPTQPDNDPLELGHHGGSVEAVAVLTDGRVVTAGNGGRVLMWDPAHPGSKPRRLGRHGDTLRAVAQLADGRVVTGGSGRRVLVWDPAHPGSKPLALGRHRKGVNAVAQLTDERVVTGGGDGRVLMWDAAHPGIDPLELGRHDGSVEAVAVLADGRVASGGWDGRVLVWDPTHPGSDPLELGHHDYPVRAVVVLPEGLVASGGHDERVLVWDVTTQTEIAQLGCSVTALAAGPPGLSESSLIVAHKGAGFSVWSVIGGQQK